MSDKIFDISWTPSLSPNVTGHRVGYRQKSAGGSFITTGFSPANDLGLGINYTHIQDELLNNIIYEFQVLTLCEGGITTPNTIVEGISLACVNPTITVNGNSVLVSFSGLGDIWSVYAELIWLNGDMFVPVDYDESVTSGGSVSFYLNSTNIGVHKINYVIRANVNGSMISQNCETNTFNITDDTPFCPAPISVTVMAS